VNAKGGPASAMTPSSATLPLPMGARSENEKVCRSCPGARAPTSIPSGWFVCNTPKQGTGISPQSLV
jgi:hypothetical protein